MDTILDLNCCFWQDLRQMVADGAPSEIIVGLDIEGPLIDVGYDLFLDRETLKSVLLVGDIFKPKQDWDGLLGEIDIINASAFSISFLGTKTSKPAAYL